MRIGFMSVYDQERIDFMRQHGFGCVELLAFPGFDYLPGQDGWKDKASEIKNAYAEAGIRISCVGGFYGNHMADDPAEAKTQHDHVRNVIALAGELGVKTVAGFAGRVVDKDLDESLPKFKAIWSEHAKAAEDAGVRIAFEHCPMGKFHSPFGGINCVATPDMWDKCFDAVPSEALGLEWDSSHLICQFIDPIANIRRYGDRIFHVHAKDAKVYRQVVDRYGIYHPGAIEHCFPGLGDSDWGQIVKELLRAGYAGDMNIEGWHDQVLVDREGAGREDWGLLISLRHLGPFVDGK